MRILVVGCGKEDLINHRKIEGFYNSFSKIGECEWVQKIFDCKYNEYDLVFGEIHLSEIKQNLDKFINMNIKSVVIWMTYSPKKIIELVNLKKDTHFINAYKTNILNKDIIHQYIEKYKIDEYQIYKDEGVFFKEILNFDFEDVPSNLEFCYLPCSLSEKEEFFSNKPYDICYFGSLNNRPVVKVAIQILSKKYNVIANGYDISGIKTPYECYQLYKSCKVTLSEQVHPVVLEYPVRLGESTSTGCHLFLIEPIKCNDVKNKFIPDYTSCQSVEDLVNKVSEYIDNFDIKNSKDIYDNFSSTYDNAVEYILTKIKNKK